MTGKRKRYSADFKAKVALEALRGELTAAQLASKHGIHQTMVGEWKKQAMEGLAVVFSDRSAAQETAKNAARQVQFTNTSETVSQSGDLFASARYQADNADGTDGWTHRCRPDHNRWEDIDGPHRRDARGDHHYSARR